MARLLRHRQTKETETDTPSLTSTAPHSYSTGPQATLQDRSPAPHLPCLNNTSNGRTGRKAAHRYILSLKQEGLRRRHANSHFFSCFFSGRKIAAALQTAPKHQRICAGSLPRRAAPRFASSAFAQEPCRAHADSSR